MCLGGLEIDDELEPGRLHDRQVGRLGTHEDVPHPILGRNARQTSMAWPRPLVAVDVGEPCPGKPLAVRRGSPRSRPSSRSWKPPRPFTGRTLSARTRLMAEVAAHSLKAVPARWSRRSIPDTPSSSGAVRAPVLRPGRPALREASRSQGPRHGSLVAQDFGEVGCGARFPKLGLLLPGLCHARVQ
jgi:hypothetical protein